MANHENVIDALSHPEPPQPQAGKDGDPQIAALYQFLLDAFSHGNQLIADFGCGNGVAAGLLEDLNTQRPFTYWAVDLKEHIDQLSLPSKVHNNSKKFTTENFFDEILPKEGYKISIVIIRNVLHELDIETTARLFTALRNHLSPECIIYIQDMQKLSKPERANIGWDKDILLKCLGEIGFQTHDYLLKSHSGVPWFTFSCKLLAGMKNVKQKDVQHIIATHRFEQLSKIEEVIKETTTFWEKSEELIILHNEFVSLCIQLRKVGWLKDSPHLEPSFEQINIPVKEPDPTLFQYACATSDNVSQNSGLIAMISSKYLLDFPTLISSARKSVSFGGYSNRHLFQKQDNLVAIKSAIQAGVEVAILIVDPDSQAALLRAQEPLYENPEAFIGSINDTIEHGLKFYAELVEELGASAVTKFKLSKSIRIPRWSYFFVDDTCYLSFYSITMSGSSAPCLVFRGIKGVANNYFHVVRNEFLDLFSESTSLI